MVAPAVEGIDLFKIAGRSIKASPLFGRTAHVVSSMRIVLSVFHGLLKRGQRKQQPIHRVFVTRKDT